MSVLAAKRKEFQAKTAEAVALRDKIAAAADGTDTKSDQEAFDKLMDVEIPALDAEIKRLIALEDAETKAAEGKEGEEGKQPERKAFAPGKVDERFVQAPTLGEQLVNFDGYKKLVEKIGAGGHPGQGEASISFDAKGFLFGGTERKDTFTLSGTGLDSSRNYLGRPVELVQQQRMTVRDLLAVGQTTQNIVYYIKEDAYTNAADMVAEEGQKPEATFDTGSANAPVKKIAVVAKVTDEMWSDFPMLRDYVNTRMRFMVEQKEEDQLLNGTGAGSQITGILQTSGIQTQAKGGDSNFIAIHKAITKVRTPTTGGYEPDGIVIHPTDWQLLRIAVDGNTQFYGGGPFSEQYGNGPYKQFPQLWGLTPVVTTAIAAGTALVGAFKTAAQIWQREGIRVETTNANEDDFNFNRISLRVEERLALAVYAPGAFCTVTSIA